MAMCKALGCFNQQRVNKKTFFTFPNPAKSEQDLELCNKWLKNLQNASLPREANDYQWSKQDVVCEEHFSNDSFIGMFNNSVAESMKFVHRFKRLKKGAVPAIINKKPERVNADGSGRKAVGQKYSITITDDCVVQQWCRVGTAEKLDEDGHIARFLLDLYFSQDKNGRRNLKSPGSCAFCRSTLLTVPYCTKCQRQIAFATVEHLTSYGKKIVSNQGETDMITNTCILKHELASAVKEINSDKSGQNAKLTTLLTAAKVGSSIAVQKKHFLSHKYKSLSSAKHLNSDKPVQNAESTTSLSSVKELNSDKPVQIEISSIGEQKLALTTSSVATDAESMQIAGLIQTGERIHQHKAYDSNQIVTEDLKIIQIKTASKRKTESKQDISLSFNKNTEGSSTVQTVDIPKTITVIFLPQTMRLSSDKTSPQDVLPQQTVTASLSHREAANPTNTKEMMQEEIPSSMEIMYDLESVKDSELADEQLKSFQKRQKNHQKVLPSLYLCNFCPKQYTRNEKLQEHISFHHTKTFKYVCEFCKKPFRSKDAKDKHDRRHIGIPTCICEKCGKGYYAAADLRRHAAIHDLDLHICKKCGRAFKKAVFLQTHMLSHHMTREKKFVCDICGRAFAFVSSMKSHRQGHLGLRKTPEPVHKPFSCAKCGQSFKSGNYLRKHLISRSGENHTVNKNFPCDICGKAFSKAYLTRHKLHHKKSNSSIEIQDIVL